MLTHPPCSGQKWERTISRDYPEIRIPLKPWFFFFRLLLSNCLNWKIHCDDHSLLSFFETVNSLTCFHFLICSFILCEFCMICMLSGIWRWSFFFNAVKPVYTVTLAKWQGDCYLQCDRYIQVMFAKNIRQLKMLGKLSGDRNIPGDRCIQGRYIQVWL